MERKTIACFQQLEAQLAERHGRFRLFGLFNFADHLWKWDVVVSAPWLDENRDHAYEIMADALLHGTDRNLALFVGGVRILDLGDPLLKWMLNALTLEHGLQDVDGIDLPLREVQKAHLITCQRLHQQAAA